MESLYNSVEDNRRRLSAITTILFENTHDCWISNCALYACGGLLVLSLTSNIMSFNRYYHTVPAWLWEVVATLQVQQSWDLFAPNPSNWNRNFRAVAHGADGSKRDLGPIFFRVLDEHRLQFADYRWLKYLSRFDKFDALAWDAFGKYVCRVAQQGNGRPKPAIVSVEVTLSMHASDRVGAIGDDRLFFRTKSCETERPADSD